MEPAGPVNPDPAPDERLNWTASGWDVDPPFAHGDSEEEPRCVCGGNHLGEIDERPDCPRHGITPEARAYQESRMSWLAKDEGEAPY